MASLADRARLVRRVGGSFPAAMRGRSTADSLLDRNARNYPDNTAIAYLDQRFTYRQVRERADQYARYFAGQGVTTGDRVAVNIDNRPDLLFVFHGLQRLGAIAALINTNLAGPPLAHVIGATDPQLTVFGSEHANTLEELLSAVPELDPSRVLVQEETPGATAMPAGVRSINVEVDRQPTAPVTPVTAEGGQPCAYIYTSGTTGLPKAAVVTHKRFAGSGALGGHVLHRVEPGELIYVALPLYHSVAMLLGWSAALTAGAGIALRRRFSASAFFDDVRRYDARTAVYIGELCRYLLNSPPQDHERDHNLRVMVGNGLRPDVWEPFQARFGVALIREFYATTEGTGGLLNLSGRPGMVGRLGLGAVIVRCDPTTGEVRRNSDGFCEKVEQGEAGLLLGRINRAVPFDGYRDEEATSRKVLTNVFKEGDRFFNSGDLLRLHERRWVSFVDRLGDTFRWKGENVSTNEVADLLNQAAGIVESNVYGVQVTGADGRAGMAELVVSDEFQLDDLAVHVERSMPTYERPVFLRLQPQGIDITGTFKHRKGKARDEGYDPSSVAEPLYYLSGGRYLPLDGEAYAKIESGEIVPG